MILILILTAATGILAQAQQLHKVTVSWDPPTHKVLNMDCEQQGTEIGPDDTLFYTVQWKVTGTQDPWTEAESPDAVYTVVDLPPETNFTIRVGAHLENRAVLCWSDEATFTTPEIQDPAPCTRPVVQSIE